MSKKVVTSLLMLAVGLMIISGVVIAKDQILDRVLGENSLSVDRAGEAVQITTGGFQSRKLSEEASSVEQPEVAVSEDASAAPQQIEFEGLVSAVDLNDGLFDLALDGSGVKAFYVDSKTSYQGSPSSFQDLSSDMQVSIVARQKADGTWRVVSLHSESPINESFRQSSESKSEGGPDPDHIGMEKLNVGGRVTSVGEATLTIQTQGGTPMTFAITETTMISSYNGTHDSLDDIKVNFTVAVIYFDGEMQDGLRVAYRVVVSNEGIAFNPYQQGWVDSVGADQFTITTNWGDTYTFMVNGSTQVRGVGSFAEIAPGMRAFVYYQDNGGTLLAKGIQVWP